MNRSILKPRQKINNNFIYALSNDNTGTPITINNNLLTPNWNLKSAPLNISTGNQIYFLYPETGLMAQGDNVLRIIPNGIYPLGGLIQATNGLLYGSTLIGGLHNNGTIYIYDIITNKQTIIHNFNGTDGNQPRDVLFQANNGLIYGTTETGGINNYGTIFVIDPSTNILTKLHDADITTGTYFFTGLMQATNGLLYGIAYSGGLHNNGVIYSFNTLTNIYSDLYDIDSSVDPTGMNTGFYQASNGLLYTMSSNGGVNSYGTIFTFDTSSNILNVVYSFNGAQVQPQGRFIEVFTNVLYATTTNGSNGNGDIFTFNILTNIYDEFFNFSATNPFATGAQPEATLLLATDGNLYGTTLQGGLGSCGTIFMVNPNTNKFTKLYDFINFTDGPYGSLIQATNGSIYGICITDLNSNGVLFNFNISTTLTIEKIYDFDGTNGANIDASLMQASNNLIYGVTENGGTANNGVLFSFDLNLNHYTNLFSFDGIDTGSTPTAALLEINPVLVPSFTSFVLYGLASSGGTYGYGTIFTFDETALAFTKIFDFDNIIGAYPSYCQLIFATNSLIYGMASQGGSANAGTIFTIDPTTNLTNKVYDFIDGGQPNGSLLQANNGLLYGLSIFGGSYSLGALFSFETDNNNYNNLYSFTFSTGIYPIGNLIQASNNLLYGLANGGNIGMLSQYGVLFSYNIVTNIYDAVYEFNSTTAEPALSLIEINGVLYGTADTGGTYGYGTIFSYNYTTNVYTDLLDFDNTNGSSPFTQFIQANNNKLYGTTYDGGTYGYGTLFEMNLQDINYHNLLTIQGITESNFYGINKTIDYANSWQVKFNTNTIPFSLWFDITKQIGYCGAVNELYSTHNSGETWAIINNNVNIGNTNSYNITEISAPDIQHIYIAGVDGITSSLPNNIFGYSTNSGASFTFFNINDNNIKSSISFTQINNGLLLTQNNIYNVNTIPTYGGTLSPPPFSPTFIPSPVNTGLAISFVGSSISYIDYGNVFYLNALGLTFDIDVTITSTTPPVGYILGKSSLTEYSLRYENSGTFYFVVTGGQVTATTDDMGNPFVYDTPYNIRCVIDVSTQTIAIYINGVRKGIDGGISGLNTPQSGSFQLGSFNTQCFAGSIDNLRIFNSPVFDPNVVTTYTRDAIPYVNKGDGNYTFDSGTYNVTPPSPTNSNYVSFNKVYHVTSDITYVVGEIINYGPSILNNPVATAVDLSGNIYISDLNNNVIRQIDNTGIITTFVGNGIDGYSGDNVANGLTSASINGVFGLALSQNGYVFFSDYNNGVIRQIQLSTSTITTIAGNTSSVLNADNVDSTTVKLSNISNIASDNFYTIYLYDDSNAAIRVIQNGPIINTVVGHLGGTNGYGGDGLTATDVNVKIGRNPQLTYDVNNTTLYIADSENLRVRKVNFSINPIIITTYAGNGTSSTNPFNGENGLATLASFHTDSLLRPNSGLSTCVDNSGNLYIADIGNNVIRKVDFYTNIITTIAGNGIAGYSGDGFLAINASLNSPCGLSYNSTNNSIIFINYGNNVVRQINLSTNIITTIAGNNTAGYGGDNLSIFGNTTNLVYKAIDSGAFSNSWNIIELNLTSPSIIIDSSGTVSGIPIGNVVPISMSSPFIGFDNSIYFDGIDRGAGFNPGINFGNNFSITNNGIDLEFKINCTSNPQSDYNNIFSKGQYDHSLLFRPDNGMDWRLSVGTSSITSVLFEITFYSDNSSTPFQFNTNYTVRLVAKEVSGTWSFYGYVNGQQVFNTTNSLPSIITTDEFYLGSDSPNSETELSMNGYIDEFIYYNTSQIDFNILTYSVNNVPYLNGTGDNLYHFDDIIISNAPSNFEPLDIFFSSNTNGYIVGTDGVILTTTNGGIDNTDNWILENSGITQSIISVHKAL